MIPSDRDPSADGFLRPAADYLAELWARDFTRPAPGPIDYSRGIRFEAPPILDLSDAAVADARRVLAERVNTTGFLVAAWPADTPLPSGVWSNHVGPPIPADLTVADIVATMQQLAPPEPEQAIITPSLDALRAVVPFVEMEPTGRRTLDGIRVVVTHLADRPQLIPAAALDRPPFTVAFEDSAAARFTRPPIGVSPGWLWREDHPRPTVDDRVDRVVELRRAIMRRVEAGQKPPLEWATEIEEHAAALQTGFVDAAESLLDQLDAIADSPEPIVVVEGPPDAAPTP